ncbi:alpha/beta hydrolase [Chryseolinea sp. T2]|uniref:alpha/beta fold hydrolase n=1 Tax=Chryseolinea sp. T2 TaxID=3129255 RepID=UPI0030786730
MALGIARTLKIVFLLIVLAIAISFHSCMSFRMSPREVDNYFKVENVEAKQDEYTSDHHQIHYVSAGDTTGPLVLFIHGSPGSLSAFIRYLADTSLLSKGLLITTDRPGFGYSNFGHGVASLEEQAAILKPLLIKHKHNRPVVLIGHSLGGPLIARMAMDYPDLIDGLIIVAGSIDPELEPNEVWFRAPLATPFLSWLLPRSLRASNEEIYHLKPELEKMLPLWSTIHCPVIVIQGKKDSLVPAENAEFARKHLVNAPVEFVFKDDMDHFVPWSNPELIHDAIVRMLTHTLPAGHTANLIKN